MGELQIPVSGHAKRVFFLVVGGSLVLIVLVRFLLIPVIFDTPFPSVAEVLNESLGDVFATVVAATVLGAVVVWASAPSAKRTDLHVLHPKDIGRTLEQALVGARSWHYDGSTGRWNLSNVLPALAAAARQTSSTRSCRLLIMDPRSESLCKTYADFRRGLRSGKAREWSIREVRVDLCATIVGAAILSHEEPLLDVRVFLKTMSPVFRIDASDHRLVLTREDKSEPGLTCEAETHFFDAFMETVNFDGQQAVELNIGDAYSGYTQDHIAVRTILENLDLRLGELEDREFLERVLKAAREPANPYES